MSDTTHLGQSRTEPSGCEYCGEDRHSACDNCGAPASGRRCAACGSLVCEIEAMHVGDAREAKGLPRQDCIVTPPRGAGSGQGAPVVWIVHTLEPPLYGNQIVGVYDNEDAAQRHAARGNYVVVGQGVKSDV